MNKYTDYYGRIHDRPVTELDLFPCNNSFLFSGELSLLAPVNKLGILKAWAECQATYGFNRNPDNKSFPISSHDEVVGMFMLFNELEAKAEYKKLEQQYFQVCNLAQFVPVQLHKLNLIKVYKQFRSLRNEEEPRKVTYKYPYILPITQRIAPQHTYFLARCASIRPSFTHSLYFCAASCFTIFGKNNSSKVMLGFKLLKLSKLGQSFPEKLLTKLYNLRVNFVDEVVDYFPADHEITRAVVEKFKNGI